MEVRALEGVVRKALIPLVALCGSFLHGCGGSASPPPPAPSITTSSLSDGTVGASYTQTIQASGTAPFSWSVSSGSLPHALALGASSSSSVTISGTPDTVQTNVAFTMQVRDASGQAGSQPFAISIKGTTAQTQSGTLQGALAGDVVAFRGVPYAAPPIGSLRWKPPQPAISWMGTRDASTFGNVCPQLDNNNQPFGSEDCLVLNIYVSSQPAHGQTQPVMVFLHGGGNIGGTTHGPITDSSLLPAQGVILVTVQYRLGLLGFFTHPLLTAEGGGSSGNYGLRDQIAALTWVHQNIAGFGGDPTHVMLFGESAGSFDVQALLASPLARGLFSVAAMESGARHQGLLPTLTNLETAESPVVQALGCGTAADVLACLRAVSADVVASNWNVVPLFHGTYQTLVIEPAALPMDPFSALQQNGSPVPLIIGSTREEESASNTTDDPTASPPLSEAQYEAAVHAEFDPIQSGAGDQVLSLYPATDYDAPVYALIAAESDFYDITRVRNLARAAAGANRPPVWRYLYIHRYENDPTLNALRAFHTADVPFVFGTPQFILGGPYTPSTAEVNFAGQMMGYWSRFAKTGDPNGSGAVQWPHYDASTEAMLQLDDTPNNLIVINGYHNTQCDYFSTLTIP
jgi:para-nitrobenzyl esterase